MPRMHKIDLKWYSLFAIQYEIPLNVESHLSPIPKNVDEYRLMNQQVCTNRGCMAKMYC